MKESITVAEATIRVYKETDLNKCLTNCDIIAIEKKGTTYVELDVIFPIVRIRNVLCDAVNVMRIKAKPWYLSQWQQFHREIEPYSTKCREFISTYWTEREENQDDTESD